MSRPGIRPTGKRPTLAQWKQTRQILMREMVRLMKFASWEDEPLSPDLDQWEALAHALWAFDSEKVDYVLRDVREICDRVEGLRKIRRQVAALENFSGRTPAEIETAKRHIARLRREYDRPSKSGIRGTGRYHASRPPRTSGGDKEVSSA
jgi:hypothetical protein